MTAQTVLPHPVKGDFLSCNLGNSLVHTMLPTDSSFVFTAAAVNKQQFPKQEHPCSW